MNERLSDAKESAVDSCDVDRRHLRTFPCSSTACWRISAETLYNGRRFEWIRRGLLPSLFASSSLPCRSWACPAGRCSRRLPNTRHAATTDKKSKPADTKLSWRRYDGKPQLTTLVEHSACRNIGPVSRQRDWTAVVKFQTTVVHAQKQYLPRGTDVLRRERGTRDRYGSRTNDCGFCLHRRGLTQITLIISYRSRGPGEPWTRNIMRLCGERTLRLRIKSSFRRARSERNFWKQTAYWNRGS